MRFRLLLLGLLIASACSESRDARGAADSVALPDATGTRVDLIGAGATFPYPLYARWFNEYATRSNVRINYQSIGSGEGVRQMLAGAVDFGATEVPMTDGELSQSSSAIVHIPTALGAVGITYNLPELSRPLRLSGEVLADIFLGTITRWNDERLRALNPGAPLPSSEIRVVHRADGSGTTYILSDYLTTVSPRWAGGPSRGLDVQWPLGVGGKGNEGVAGQVKETIGAIGYLEVVYARQNRLPVAHVRNRAGRFVSPMPFEIASAAAGVADSSTLRGLRRSLVDAQGEQAYPIASFTWILLSPARIGDQKTQKIVAFLRWALSDGSDIASSLGYVALPTVTASPVLDLLDSLRGPAASRR